MIVNITQAFLLENPYQVKSPFHCSFYSIECSEHLFLHIPNSAVLWFIRFTSIRFKNNISFLIYKIINYWISYEADCCNEPPIDCSGFIQQGCLLAWVTIMQTEWERKVVHSTQSLKDQALSNWWLCWPVVLTKPQSPSLESLDADWLMSKIWEGSAGSHNNATYPFNPHAINQNWITCNG